MLAFLVLLAFAFRPSFASGHGGGLDAEGGHTDRRIGEYHHHGDKEQRVEPSADGERPRHGPKLDVAWMRQHGRKAVKAKYGLTMDGRERQALEAVLAQCSPARAASLAM